jgi:methylenetetrahydrofolate dehydrogenase (NADP+) / methenyltetrahydrofolate cyclohydrolase
MIIDWKALALKTYEELKEKIGLLKKKPTLVAVLVWHNDASNSYIWQKKKFAEYVGMNFRLLHFDEKISEYELIKEIHKLNNDFDVSWFIVQLPLPNNMNPQKVVDAIDPRKDVDWFSKENVGKLFYGDHSWLESCTPKWIKRLFDEYCFLLKWKTVTIIGKSNIVGKPLSLLFINNSATVTICDVYTPNLKEHTLKSDYIVCAVWMPNLITKDMITPWSVIIDVWINKVNGKIVWDCDFENLEKDNFITPVPGWVGPMTVAMLIENTYLAHVANN